MIMQWAYICMLIDSILYLEAQERQSNNRIDMVSCIYIYISSIHINAKQFNEIIFIQPYLK